MMNQEVSDDRRQEVFFALVSSQDNGTSVKDSREIVAARFELSMTEVLAIERAGIAAKWPPLNHDSD